MTAIFKNPARWNDTNVRFFSPPINLVSEKGAPSLEVTWWSPDQHRLGIRWLRRAGDAPWGAGSYTLYTFELSKRRKRPLGLVKQVAYSEALKKAKSYAAALADPSRNLAAEIAAAEQAQGDLFPSYLERFFAWHAAERHTERHIKSLRTYLSEKFLPSLQTLPLRYIRRQHVADALDALMHTRGQYTKTRASLSSYFEFLAMRGVVEDNPARHIQKFEKGKRERYLDEEELRALLGALDYSRRFDRLVGLILLTGTRRDQIGWLTHDRIKDLDGPNPRLELPPSGGNVRGGSKNGKTFTLPLSSQAASLLRRQLAERLSDRFIFGKKAGYGHWSRSLNELRTRAGVKDWCPHDLRRTFATLASERLKADTQVIDAAINHTPAHRQGVAGVYQKNEMLDERAALAQRWGNYCEALAPPRPGLSLVAA